MKSLKVKLIAILSFVSIILAIMLFVNINNRHLTTAFAQTVDKSCATNSEKSSLNTDRSTLEIVDEAPESNSASERKRRSAKDRRYDKPNKITSLSNGEMLNKKLTDLPDGLGVTVISEEPTPPPLPVEQSEAIVLGTVTQAQPYLTTSKTSLYTEFTFEVEDVLKNNLGSIAVGNSIKVDREAGALRSATGKIIRYQSGGSGNLLHVGQRYLLFLKSIHNGEDISFIAGYEFQNGKIIPLKESSVYSPNTGKITKNSPFLGMAETQFLQVLRDTIANSTNASTIEGRDNQ